MGNVGTIIDLSHAIADGIVTYPGLPGPVISDHLSREASRERYAPGYEFQIGRIEMVSNTGTYLDTPFHRFADGHDLAGLDLSRVVAVPGVLVDATAGQEAGADAARRSRPRRPGGAVPHRLGPALGQRRYGEPRPPLRRRWRRRRAARRRAARPWSASTRSTSTTPAPGERPIHTALLGAGIPIVEHLCRLGRLGGRPFTFTAAPPAVVGMGTFPVRAFAMVE